MTEKRKMSRDERARYVAAVDKIRKLLERWLDTGIELFLAMREVEKRGDWKLPGYATFTDFLHDEFKNALGFEKYNNVIQALELYGESFVRKIGVNPCHAVSVKAMADSAANRKQLVEAVEVHIQQQGVPPDRNKITRMVREIAGLPPRLSPETELVALRTEVKRLKAECARLRERVAELESERERLLRNGVGKGGRKAAARRAHSKSSKSLRP